MPENFKILHMHHLKTVLDYSRHTIIFIILRVYTDCIIKDFKTSGKFQLCKTFQ